MDNVPRVLQLIDSFEQGGSESQAVQLTGLLTHHGRYQIYVACLKKKGVLLSQLEGFAVEDIPEFPLTSFYDRNALRQMKRFASFLKKRQIDIVHTHDFYTNIFGTLGAALARVPVRIASRRESGKKNSNKRRVERFAYRFAHSVIANCDHVRDQLVAEGLRPNKLITIYNGLEDACFSEATSSREEVLQRFGLSELNELRIVTSVANLRQVKDYPTFLRSAAEILRSVPNSAFLVAGEGEMLGALRSLSGELGVGDRVFFLGRCESIADLLSISDVCVLSSSSEGFSNAILEYMAAARPVVVTDVGGAREAVSDGETGYIVGVGDHERMAAYVVSLLAQPEQARAMGLKGQQQARERFSCEVRLRKTEKLYEELIGRATSRWPS